MWRNGRTTNQDSRRHNDMGWIAKWSNPRSSIFSRVMRHRTSWNLQMHMAHLWRGGQISDMCQWTDSAAFARYTILARLFWPLKDLTELAVLFWKSWRILQQLLEFIGVHLSSFYFRFYLNINQTNKSGEHRWRQRRKPNCKVFTIDLSYLDKGDSAQFGVPYLSFVDVTESCFKKLVRIAYSEEFVPFWRN